MTDYAKLFEQDRAHFMHPSTHAHDHASGALPGRIITGASGVRIRDHQGRELLDAFAGWEPGAFAGPDSLYAGQTGAGYDASGRFMPWWYRKADGSLTVEAMGDTLESQKVLPTGVREGEYYLCPKERHKPCVIDPAPYEMGGRMVLMSSFNAPILVDGRARPPASASCRATSRCTSRTKPATPSPYSCPSPSATPARTGR